MKKDNINKKSGTSLQRVPTAPDNRKKIENVMIKKIMHKEDDEKNIFLKSNLGGSKTIQSNRDLKKKKRRFK